MRTATTTAPKYDYYYEEIPLRKVVAVEKEIDRRLRADEYRQALKCSPFPAYTEITMNKTGQKFVVARAKQWDSDRGGYNFKVQILTEDCDKVVKAYVYKDTDENPLLELAATIIRLGRSYRYFD